MIGGRTLPEGLAGGACTADRGAAVATLKPRPNHHHRVARPWQDIAVSMS